MSLLWKLLFAFSAVVLVSVTTVSLVVNSVAVREVRGFMSRGGMGDAEALEELLAAYYQGRGSWEGVGDFLQDTFSTPSGGPQGMMRGMMRAAFLVADSQGEVISSRGWEARGELSEDQLQMAQPIVVNDATVGYLVTGTGVSPAPAEGVVARVNRATWLAALAGGAAALVLGGAIAFGLLKPVRELTEAAEGLAVGELSRRVRVRTTDELGELSLSFNQMAEALERAEVTRQDMTADIAHELRTPLAIIQARLEAVMDGVHDPSRETLEPILQQTRTLNRLIDDLRTLALADAGELALEDTQVDLRAFLEREVNAFSRQAEGAGVDLHLELPADLSLNAVLDPVRMRQVLANLITNAIRHTPRGGEVWVSLLHPTPAAFRIIVQDNGEGIPAESAERVFERFYRADRGRAREKGGTGLGLAIARKLVQAHAGSLWAESPPEGGARFVLEIPLKGQREGDHSAG